ncbi:hypothetical protein FO014_01925 [Serratia rhizosphaerae]|uniref:DUF1010 domain-containing protein n=1 Tax=Serratia rhizosphaerae TaxID=2597702 RepID=A0ABX6GHU9_9GAMM|nr:hypothetical protein FO014_01925 [Serratia rhizosphaerae]
MVWFTSSNCCLACRPSTSGKVKNRASALFFFFRRRQLFMLPAAPLPSFFVLNLPSSQVRGVFLANGWQSARLALP